MSRLQVLILKTLQPPSVDRLDTEVAGDPKPVQHCRIGPYLPNAGLSRTSCDVLNCAMTRRV